MLVILFNFLPWLIAIVGVLLTIKFKKWWIPALFVALFVVYQTARPSYAPMGEIQRSSVPAFEGGGGEIKDISIKPKTDYDARQKKAYEEGLDFIK